MAFVILVVLFLKVNLRNEVDENKTEEQRKKEHWKELKNLFTPSILIFLGLMTSNGLAWGLKMLI